MDLMEWMDEYEKRFGKSFPSYQLMGRGEDGVIEIIKECLEKGKIPYDLGYLKLDVTY